MSPSRWSDRLELDQEARPGHQYQHVADRRVAVPVANEQPDQTKAEGGDVEHGVVVVEEPDQVVVTQNHPLGAGLARKVKPPLPAGDVAPAPDRSIGPGQGQVSGQLPEGVEGENQRQLARPGRQGAECGRHPVFEDRSGRGCSSRPDRRVLPRHPLHFDDANAGAGLPAGQKPTCGRGDGGR
jgi:hypothetical protein